MQVIYLHPKNPQPRLLEQIKQTLIDGKIVAYPSEIGYVLLTHINAKNALQKITHIDSIEHNHFYTIICSNISNASTCVQIDNEQFRLIKNAQCGTRFILNASKQTPKHLFNQKNKNIGIQIIGSQLLIALLEVVGDNLVIHNFNSHIDTKNPHDIEDVLDGKIDILVNVDIIDVISLKTIDIAN